MRKSALSMLLACALLLTACARQSAPDYERIVADARVRYAALQIVDRDPADDLGASQHPPVEWETYAGPAPAFQRSLRIPAQQAAEDVSALFDLLAAGYGGYGYFGGDAVFDGARDRLLGLLAEEEAVTGEWFEALVRQSLAGIITDSHFTLNAVALNPRVIPYFAQEAPSFSRDGRGFCRLSDGLRLAQAEGYDLEELMRPSLTASGEVVYRPCPLAPEDAPPGGLTLRYADGSAQTLELSTPYRYPGGNGRFACALAQQPWQGAAVLTLSTMSAAVAQDPGGPEARTFVDQVLAAREASTLVLDLRDNPGGHILDVDLFMAVYTGSASRPSKFRMAQHTAAADDDQGGPWSIEGTDTGVLLNGRPIDRLEGRPTVIVLVNKNTASAAELLCDALISCPDVDTLLLGTNTRGSVINGMGFQLILPHSRLRVAFGPSLRLSPEGYCPETLGMTPDLWVEGDALQAALALLERR